jgi:serine/threonine protein kinase
MSALSEPDALVGSLLGKVYRVVEPIGVGGMAIVYLVEHQTLLKRFAAKVLSPELASSLEARARFIQEAHAASALDHENIVSISDFGTTHDQRPFFVMELLRGKTLDRRLTDGTMTIEEVVAVAVPVARALSHAHAEGIVHLDVKPENIFLVQRSRGRWGVKVVDFGIAKTPLNPRLNKLGETAGSPMFMAPEVCRGDDDVDQRADVYSFGIMLYLMLCGRLPFVDDSAQRVLQMQLIELPPPPNEVNTQLSPEIAMVIERALAKDRADRYASMEALLSDLAAALPPGADRLLIEAQSGAAVQDTPFSGSLSISRPGSQPRAASTVSPITPLPRRKRSGALVLLAVAVVGLIGLLTWRQVVDPGSSRSASRTADSRTASMAAVAPAPAEELAAAAKPTDSKGTDDSAAQPTAAQPNAAQPNAAQPNAAQPSATPPSATPTSANPPSATPPSASPTSADPTSATPTSATPTSATSTSATPTSATPSTTPTSADPTNATLSAATTSADATSATPPNAQAPAVAAATAPDGSDGDQREALAEVARAEPEPGREIGTPPASVVERSKAPAASTKKPPVRSKPAPRPVLRPATTKPIKRPPVVAAATAAPAPTAAPPPPPVEEVQGPQTPAGSPIETEVQPEPPAPPPPPPEPAAAPPPVAPALAVVKPPAKPTPPAPGSLDATPSVASLEVKGSLSPAIVRRSLERTLSSLRGCYRTAARAVKATPAVELRLSFEIDENSLATQVATSGANFGSLSRCAAGVAGQIRTQEAPDVGTAQVTAVIRFRPS